MERSTQPHERSISDPPILAPSPSPEDPSPDPGQWLELHREPIFAAVSKRLGPAPVGAPNLQESLDYLVQALRNHQPALFHDYVAWAKIVLATQGSTDPLRDALERLAEVLREQAGPHAGPLVAPVAKILDAFDALPTESSSHLDPATNEHFDLARRYLDALLAGRRSEAVAEVVGAVDDGLPIRDVYLSVLQPVQYEIGRLWQTNKIAVAQEHLFTATTQLIMSQLYSRLFADAPTSRQILVAGVSGDLHEIGARILADFFEMEGWDTSYLGANVMLDDITSTLLEQRIDVAALSVTMVHHVPRIREAIAAIRSIAPQTAIIVGGYPFSISPELWRELGADGTAGDAKGAVELASRLVTR